MAAAGLCAVLPIGMRIASLAAISNETEGDAVLTPTLSLEPSTTNTSVSNFVFAPSVTITVLATTSPLRTMNSLSAKLHSPFGYMFLLFIILYILN